MPCIDTCHINRKVQTPQKRILDFWSKWRDSNSRHPAPKARLELFSNNFRSFWHLLFRKSCSLEPLSPLFPRAPKPDMVNNVVNNVVKSKHSPVHIWTGELFFFCGVVIVAWKTRTVKLFLCLELRGYKQRNKKSRATMKFCVGAYKNVFGQ